MFDITNLPINLWSYYGQVNVWRNTNMNKERQSLLHEMASQSFKHRFDYRVATILQLINNRNCVENDYVKITSSKDADFIVKRNELEDMFND